MHTDEEKGYHTYLKAYKFGTWVQNHSTYRSCFEEENLQISFGVVYHCLSFQDKMILIMEAFNILENIHD